MDLPEIDPTVLDHYHHRFIAEFDRKPDTDSLVRVVASIKNQYCIPDRMQTILQLFHGSIPPQRGPELDKDEWLTRYVCEEDTTPVLEFLQILGNGLWDQSVPSAILAVGSSTFAPRYWVEAQCYNHYQRWAGGEHRRDEEYNDIDFRVVAKKSVASIKMRDVLMKVMEKNKIPFEVHENKLYHEPFQHLGYGCHSLHICLSNNTKASIIINTSDEYYGPDNLMRSCRLQNRPDWCFSLLLRGAWYERSFDRFLQPGRL